MNKYPFLRSKNYKCRKKQHEEPKISTFLMVNCISNKIVLSMRKIAMYYLCVFNEIRSRDKNVQVKDLMIILRLQICEILEIKDSGLFGCFSVSEGLFVLF